MYVFIYAICTIACTIASYSHAPHVDIIFALPASPGGEVEEAPLLRGPLATGAEALPDGRLKAFAEEVQQPRIADP